MAFDRKAIRKLALELGFSDCRFSGADLYHVTGERLDEFVASGRHGTMQWMADTLERRRHPKAMWPQARSAIVLAMEYGPSGDPLETLGLKDRATISVYARNRDYHEVMKGRLKQIAQKIAARCEADVKVFVDTAPLMEKPLGELAGLGWQGKHTNLVSRKLGSWFFIGTILTDHVFEPDAPEIDHCGSCRACLDSCPTDAFPAPYQIDARRCISYLTIEHDGPIPRQLRPLMGNRIYGCDDCLAVCPWNKFASAAKEAKLAARDDLKAPALARLAELDDAAFRVHFAGSPIKRIGRNRFLRNVLVAIGNSGKAEFAGVTHRLLADPSPMVRGTAIWALSRLLSADAFNESVEPHIVSETDESVLEEWQACMREVSRTERNK